MNRDVLHEVSQMNKQYIKDLQTSGRGDPYYDYNINPMTSQHIMGGSLHGSLYPEIGLNFATTSGEKPGTIGAHYVNKKKGKGMTPEDDAKSVFKKPRKPSKSDFDGNGKKIVRISKPRQPSKSDFDMAEPKTKKITKPKQPSKTDFDGVMGDVEGGIKYPFSNPINIKEGLMKGLKKLGKMVATPLLDVGADLLRTKGVDFLKSKIKDKIDGLGKKNKKGHGNVGLVQAQVQMPTKIASKEKIIGKGKPNKWLSFLKSKNLNPRTMPKKNTEAYNKLMKEYRK
jgi:hypothetical protein